MFLAFRFPRIGKIAVSVVRVDSKACVRRKEFSRLAAVVEHGDVFSNIERRYMLYQSQVG